MPLDFQLGKIKDFKKECFTHKSDYQDMHPLTKTIIFGTISTGIGKINLDNYKVFWARYHIVNKTPHDVLIAQPTLFEVKKHIGLTTNVFGRYGTEDTLYHEPHDHWLVRVFGRSVSDLIWRADDEERNQDDYEPPKELSWQELSEDGQKIEAIKKYRTVHDCAIHVAHKAVNEYERTYNEELES